MKTFWTTPRGAGNCVVARVDRSALRIAHVRDAAEAIQLEREWAEGNFDHNAGRITVFRPSKHQLEQQQCEP